MAAGRRGIFQLDFAHRQSDEKMEDFGQGRVVDEESNEKLEAGQLATARLLLISAWASREGGGDAKGPALALAALLLLCCCCCCSCWAARTRRMSLDRVHPFAPAVMRPSRKRASGTEGRKTRQLAAKTTDDDVICGWMKRRSQSNPRTRRNFSANLLIDRRKN